MTRGRTTAILLHITPDEHATLRHMLRQTVLPAGLMRRARLLMLLAAGHSITDAARGAGLSRTQAYKWLWRWQQTGLAGLQEQPRGGGGARPGAGRPRRRRETPLC